jgi:hypothetical protein
MVIGRLPNYLDEWFRIRTHSFFRATERHRWTTFSGERAAPATDRLSGGPENLGSEIPQVSEI